MKFQGITLDKPKPEVLVVPHNGVEVVFKAECVTDYSEFDKLCPTPVPPKKLLAGGKEEVDTKDKDYLKEVDDWSDRRSNWMFLKSLQASDHVEWDIVDMQDPSTWNKFDEEFISAGFVGPIIERIKMLVFKACGLDQSMIDEATERFLVGQAQESSNETSQDSEQ